MWATETRRKPRKVFSPSPAVHPVLLPRLLKQNPRDFISDHFVLSFVSPSPSLLTAPKWNVRDFIFDHFSFFFSLSCVHCISLHKPASQLPQHGMFVSYSHNPSILPPKSWLPLTLKLIRIELQKTCNFTRFKFCFYYSLWISIILMRLHLRPRIWGLQLF